MLYVGCVRCLYSDYLVSQFKVWEIGVHLLVHLFWGIERASFSVTYCFFFKKKKGKRKEKERKMVEWNKPLLLSIVVISFFVFYSVMFWFNSTFSSKKWYRYGATLFHLGIIVTLVAFVYDEYEKEQHAKQEKRDEVTDVSISEFENIHNTFLRYEDRLWPLYQEMYQTNTFLQSLDKAVVTPQTLPSIFAFASSIFHHMDVTLSTFENAGMEIPAHYILQYQSWFQSPLLRNIWFSQAFFFSLKRQAFIQNRVLSPLRT